MDRIGNGNEKVKKGAGKVAEKFAEEMCTFPDIPNSRLRGG